jgi:hypothetical protein
MVDGRIIPPQRLDQRLDGAGIADLSIFRSARLATVLTC